MSVIRAAVALLFVVTLAGCAASPSDPGPVPSDATSSPDDSIPAPSLPVTVPTPAPGTEVTGIGTVIDDGAGANLCYAVMESSPPQCGSPLPLEGWDWAGLESEESGGVRWGDYTVFGEFDGEQVTVSRAPEPAGQREPWPSHTGPLASDELAVAQAQIKRDLPSYLSITQGDGFVHVSVLYDDGTLQSAFEDRYGEGAVVVAALLSPATS